MISIELAAVLILATFVLAMLSGIFIGYSMGVENLASAIDRINNRKVKN